jgi:glucose-1-phosphatase
MAETMSEYDAIVDDETAALSAPARNVPIGSARPYTLNGTLATNSFRGIVLEQGQKTLRH